MTDTPNAGLEGLVALLPCICGAVVDQDECPYPTGPFIRGNGGRRIFKVTCTNPNCGWNCIGYSADGARKAWNTRATYQSLPGAEGDAMDAKILLLASEMLDEYSDRLGNDGCNDWDWPESWTSEDRALFLAKFHRHNRSQPRDIEDWGDTLGNSSVAYTLAKELAALASRRELGGVA